MIARASEPRDEVVESFTPDARFALLTKWSAYQVTTEVLTHEVSPRVGPERARGFERIAANALQVPGDGRAPH